jgi:hypothetical protein
MNERVNFFAPECPEEILAALGDSWEFQNQNAEQRSLDYINELGKRGDEILHALVNGKTSTGWQFVSTAATGKLKLLKVGQVIGGFHIDSEEASWGNNQIKPKMTIVGHAHDGVQGGHNTCRTYSPTVEFEAVAFGIPANLGGVSLSESAEVDFRSARYSLSCSHIDETGRAGNQLKGENHDGVESLSVEFTGDAAPGDYAITDGWSKPSSSRTPSNTGVTTSSIELVHHIKADE